MIPLWHLDCKLIKYKGVELVRVSHRTNQGFFGGKSSRDLDPKGALGDDAATRRTRDFIREELLLTIPLPVGPRALCRILRLEAFPSLEEWEKLCGEGYYDRGDYQHDLRIFWDNYQCERTHEELWANTIKLAKRLPASRDLSAQDKAAYARGVAGRDFAIRRERLDAFLGIQKAPKEVERALADLIALGQTHEPEYKRSKAKMLKHSESEQTSQTVAPQKKSSKKFSDSGAFQTLLL